MNACHAMGIKMKDCQAAPCMDINRKYGIKVDLGRKSGRKT